MLPLPVCGTHSGQVLLGKAVVLPAQLDHLAHLQRDPLVVQLLRLAVQLGRVPGHQVLLVLTRRPCGEKRDGVRPMDVTVASRQQNS